MAVWTTVMTSPASAPIIVKPRMRSSLSLTRTFMKPCFSSVVSARSTALIGSFATRTAMPRRCAFAQPHVGEWRVREHAIWDQPVARAAIPSGQIILDDPEVVDRYVRELRAAGAFTDGPDPRRA